jgi:hypothetical protein
MRKCPTIGSEDKKIPRYGYRGKLCSLFTLAEKLFSVGSANGTYAVAGTAFNAGVSVDNVLAVALGNSVHGALIGTSAAADAIVIDLISHDIYLLMLLMKSRETVCPPLLKVYHIPSAFSSVLGKSYYNLI